MRTRATIALLAFLLYAPQAGAQKAGTARVVVPVGIPAWLGAAGAAPLPSPLAPLPLPAPAGVPIVHPALSVPYAVPAVAARPAATAVLPPAAALAANLVAEPDSKKPGPGTRGRLDAAAGQASELPKARTAEQGKGGAGIVFEQGAAAAPEAPAVPADALRAAASPWMTRKQLGRLEASPRAPGKPFTFAVVGDAEPGRFFFSRWLWGEKGVFRRHLEQMEKAAPDFVIQLGDMVSRPKRRNLLAFFRDLADSGLTRPFLTVIGNHDRRKPHGVTDSDSYRSHFGATNYAFDRGGARFVVVDTSAGRLSPRQLRWLDAQLDTPDRKLVFTHMAPVTPETIAATHPVMKNGGFTQGAAEFVDIVGRRGADRVYAGHMHGFATFAMRGVRYVLSGGGGSPLYPVPWLRRFYHHILVTVGPEGVTDSVRRLDGTGFTLD